MKIGLFGGSFNPVHNGHIAIAEAAKREFGLSRVLFMVAKDPPHKTVAGHVEASVRYAMTECALRDPAFTASDLEIRRPGKSYTLLTVRELRSLYPDAELFCIVGADMLSDLPNWYHADEIMAAAPFIGVGRAGVGGDTEEAAASLRERFGARIALCDFVGPDISSTKVRQAVYDAQSIADWAPAPVEAFIYEHGLYFPEDFCTLQARVRATLGKKRYVHTMGTVRCAVDLAARYGADGKAARLAALLHDCAKFDKDAQLALARSYELDGLEGLTGAFISVLHGPLGAELARREYGVTDEAILSAVRCHTLCRKDMTALEKIVYLADKIEPGRAYDGVETIRAAAAQSLNAGMLACMDYSIAYVQKKGKTLHPGILDARKYIQEQEKEAQH